MAAESPDKIASAIDSVEQQEAEKAAEPEATCAVTLVHLSNGGITLASSGDLKPAVAWAMGEFLRNVGDDMFRTQIAATRARQQATGKSLEVPGRGLVRVS